MATKQPKPPLTVETLNHQDDKRKNIPTAEYQWVMATDEQKPVRVEYERTAAGTFTCEAEEIAGVGAWLAVRLRRGNADF